MAMNSSGRPQKNNADWFRHDTNMRNDSRVKYLRSKYKLIGYAVWCCLLELLADSDYFKIKWNEMQIMCYAGDFDISDKQLTDIVSDCLKLDLLQLDGDTLSCRNLTERMAKLTEKREKNRTPVAAQQELLETTSSAEIDNFGGGNANFNGRNATDKIRVDNTRVDKKEDEDKKNSVSNVRPAGASEQKETFSDFLEIFFFRGVPCPWEETERFVDHYEKLGWVSANGIPIRSRLAAARGWETKKGATPTRAALPGDFIAAWRPIYERAKLVLPDFAYVLLSVMYVHFKGEKVLITLSRKEYSLLLKIWDKLKLEVQPGLTNNFKYPVTFIASKK